MTDTKTLIDWADKHLMTTAKRAPVALVRGEGARVWDTRRQGVSRLHRRHRGDRARALPSQGGRDDARAGGHAAPRVEPLLHPAADPARQAALRPLVRRPGLLLQLGRGGQRVRDQARAQVGQGARGQRSRRHHHDAGRLPRPDAGHRHRHRAGEVPPRLRAAPRWLQVRPVQRSARGGAGHRQPHRRGHGRADPGRGRHQHPGRRLPARAPQAVRRGGHPARARRDPDRHGTHRPALGLRALRHRARHHDAGQGARQRGADRRDPGHRERGVGVHPGHPRLHLRRQPVRRPRWA